MHRRAALAVALVLICWGHPQLSGVSEAARPGPLVCGKGHKGDQACPMPNQCQVRVSDKCVKGECPPILNAPDGTSCDDGNGSTVGDACTLGVARRAIGVPG
jgi:hypothetical protein